MRLGLSSHTFGIFVSCAWDSCSISLGFSSHAPRKKQKSVFCLFFARFALFTSFFKAVKIGFASEKTKKRCFVCFFARLALSLHDNEDVCAVVVAGAEPSG